MGGVTYGCHGQGGGHGARGVGGVFVGFGLGVGDDWSFVRASICVRLLRRKRCTEIFSPHVFFR